MKKLILMGVLISMLICGSSAWAQNPNPYAWKALGFETLLMTSGSGVSSFTVPTGTWEAVVTFAGGTARMRLDGTNAGASTGHKINDGDVWILQQPIMIGNARLCVDSASSGCTVTITYVGK